ncbi:MAG: TonB family protein [Bacteroidota bacterium]
MSTFINYMIEANIGLMSLMLFYKLLLEKETDFKLIRLAMIAGILVCATFPLLHIENSQTHILSISEVIPAYWLPEVSVSASGNAADVTAHDVWMIISALYATGFTFFLLRFLMHFRHLRQLMRSANLVTRTGSLTIVESQLAQSTFSFFNFICIARPDSLSEEERTQIIAHEAVHARQLHSLDILLLTLVEIVFWFNPVVKIYRKIFVQLHEFEADARAVENHHLSNYCSLLAKVALQSADFKLANHFNNSITLKRINMMRTHKSKMKSWKLMAIAAMLPLLFFTLACQDQIGNGKETTNKTPAKAEQLSPPPTQEQVFTVVEQMPEYEGGFESMATLISENLTYPEAARQKGIEGTVFVSFIVEKDGTATEAALVKGIDNDCDVEAVRVVKLLQNWKPGMEDGKSVRTKFVIPIKFKLQ